MNNVRYIVQCIQQSGELTEMIGDKYLLQVKGKYSAGNNQLFEMNVAKGLGLLER